MRRAFTLIEVVLAMAIGSIVMITSLGLLATLDRTNTRLEVRHRQRMEMSRTRSVLQDAMTSLVIDDSTPIEDDASPSVERPPKRLDLQVSPSRGAQRLFRQARLAGVDLGDPQRFELVLSNPPPPGGTLLAQRWLEQMDQEAPTRDVDVATLTVSTQGDRPTYRGAFELWPDGVRPGGREAETAWPTTQGMTLWWRPVIDVEDPVVRQREINRASVPLCSGLVACQWRVFSESQRKTVYDATWVTDLPSYVEFEANTNMNVHVNWMFEIVWTEGPESEVDVESADRADDETDRNAEGDVQTGGGGRGAGGGRAPAGQSGGSTNDRSGTRGSTSGQTRGGQ